MYGNVEIAFAGNLTDDPELRFTPSGAAVARFSVAVNRRVRNAAGEWMDADPSFYQVTAWRQLAENVAESLRRGARVVVTGTLNQRHWETDAGEKRHTWQVTAEDVGASMAWATVAVRKTVRGGAVAPDDPWATASSFRAPEPDRADPHAAGGDPQPADDEPPF